MNKLSTRQAAVKLRISYEALARYIALGKVPSPEVVSVGKGTRVIHAWTEAEIEHVRKLLPKIANGRKTRYQKLREKQKAQTKSSVPRKSKKKKST
jgi:hypothetical protein